MLTNILWVRQFWYSKNVLCNLVLPIPWIFIYPTLNNYNKRTISQTSLVNVIKSDSSVSAVYECLCYVTFTHKHPLNDAILVFQCILVLSCWRIWIYPTPHNYNPRSISQKPIVCCNKKTFKLGSSERLSCFVIFYRKPTLDEAILVLTQ